MAKCKITISFLFVILIVGVSDLLFAATIEVHPGESIQTAIDQASSGDTVLVYAGTYTEDITMKPGVDLTGESYARVTIKGRVFFIDADCDLIDFTVLFPEASLLSYSNTYYADWSLEADAGITVVNSAPLIQNCVIRPDLGRINSQGGYNPPLERYGKAIQIWNMYSNPDVAPQIEANLIRDTDCGIYSFAQAFGGAVYGEIRNNTFYNNKIGVLLRMHKENPVIKNNIFDNCVDAAVWLAYEDDALLGLRKDNIFNNLFNDNPNLLFVDSSQASFGLIDLQNYNAEDIPGYVIISGNMFYLDPGSPALNMSDTGSYVGAYPSDAAAPTVTISYPSAADNKFMGIAVLSVSGQVSDDVGVASVLINAQAANINGAGFSAAIPVTYGVNQITATGYDLAGRTSEDSKEIYLFRTPIAPPPF